MDERASHKENQEFLHRSLLTIDVLLNRQFTVQEIGEIIPGTLHVNSLSDFSLQYFDKSGEDIYKCPFEIVKSEGVKLMQKVLHPDDFANIPPCLQLFATKEDRYSVFSFFQRLKTISGKHYQWFFTSSKLSKHGLISISHSVKNLQTHKLQIESILDENVFFKKNFKKFLSLTKREKEILKELAVGMTAPQISDKFFISINTVKTHRQRIFQKLEVKTFTELYKYAFHFDLL